MTGRGRPEIGLSGAALLQAGLEALARGDVPAAIGSLAAIDDATWWAVLTRFPTLPDHIRAAIDQVWGGQTR